MTLRFHFTAQARQKKHTFQSQNSCSGAVLDESALIFMHRRGGFALCAQARWFCKAVQNHCACRRKPLVCKTVKNPRQFDSFGRKSQTASRGMAVIFALSASPAAEGQKRLLEPFSGTFSAASRTPPGRLPDTSRTSFGRLPGTSRTPSACSDAGFLPKLFVLALYDV